MEEIKIDQKIDLRGVKCPLNYVKAKLRLEELKIGEFLEVFLDDGEPILNVPRSIKEDGHKILSIEKVNNCYKVIIKKG